MRVSIYTGNHGNAHGIADLVCLLRNAVRDCGHDPIVSNVIEQGKLNILIENFGDERQQEYLMKCKTPSTRYVVIATERITGESFNAGVVSKHHHYSDQNYWKHRFDGFRLVAQVCEAVWVLDKTVVDSYAALMSDKRVRFIPHGYVNDFGQVKHRSEADKDIDFFFSGSLTEHRCAILNELATHHRVCFLQQASPDYLRMDMLARTKVCLSLRLSPMNELPSVSRMHFHLQNCNYLVHEQYVGSCPLDPYVIHSPSEDIVDWARAALEVTNKREVADAALARFRAEMPMTQWMPALLADAIGDLGVPEAAPLLHAA
jgi:hypothetical protein